MCSLLSRVRICSGYPGACGCTSSHAIAEPPPTTGLQQALAFKLVEILKKILLAQKKNLILFATVNYLKDEIENKQRCRCGECRALPACLEPSVSAKEKDK